MEQNEARLYGVSHLWFPLFLQHRARLTLAVKNNDCLLQCLQCRLVKAEKTKWSLEFQLEVMMMSVQQRATGACVLTSPLGASMSFILQTEERRTDELP